MCGVVGFFHKNEDVPGEVLEKATFTLNHRGPDARKTWISPSRKVGLGHARLSIIDLTTGDQPLSNRDGSIHAVVNGEFYGFQEIRKHLENQGHHFKTKSDSEILIHLYEELGAQAVHQLRGEFAFILWDESNKTLLAGRDRFGIKPLYYTLHNGNLLLASEAKALFAAGVPAKWDTESFHHMNALGTTLQNRTLFEKVFQVPPGCMILATKNSFQVIRYWDFDYPVLDTSSESSPHKQSQEDAIAEFRDTLSEAIRLRLHADVPVGCYLSGGLDSCSVLGLASKFSSTPVHAFTLGFDLGDYDETPIAEEMARKAGAKFRQIPIQQNDLADHFSDTLWHAETILNNAHAVAKFLLSQAVRDAGYKVVLTGEGSDEILAGYPHFRRDKWLTSQAENPEKLKQMLHELQSGNKVSSALLLPHGEVQKDFSLKRTLGFIPSWMETFSTGAITYQSLYLDSYAQEVDGVDVYQKLTDTLDIRGQLRGRDPVAQAMYLWSKVLLPNYILTVLGDRMEMAHSVEGRVPFLDHHVVEKAVQLPGDLKISGMTEKFILREAVKPELTETVYKREKHPFVSPPATLKQGERLFRLLRDTVSSSSFRNQPFFDQGKVTALLDSVMHLDDQSKAAYDVVLSGVLSTALLQERFGMA